MRSAPRAISPYPRSRTPASSDSFATVPHVVGALSRTQMLLLAAVAVLTTAAGVTHYANTTALVAFAFATGALAGLAWVVGFATEQVGEHFGPAVTGVLQSTLGNLPEFFVVIFALRAGQTVVAETSILGSLFANALLVLGLVIIAGARHSGKNLMRFNTRLPNDTVTMLMLASFIIVLLGISVTSSDHASHHVKAISIVGAIALLVTYVTWVVPYLRSDNASPSHASGEKKNSLVLPIVLLTIAGAGAAVVSDWFVSALTPTIDRLHISQAFAGIVIVAIAGNAVENVAGIMLAAKGQADLAISVVKNSVAQVAAFLYPAMILVSLLFSTPLTFSLAPIYIGALLLSALAVWQISGDGEASAFEGVALIAIYVVLGVITIYE